MLNNPALNVALGLVFIYAIYSLITTTLTELISSWINLRGKVLRAAIQRMLDDDDANDSELSKIFLNRPEYKYLGKKSLFSKKSRLPSYLKPKTFARTLFQTLNQVYDANDELENIKSKLNKENETQKFLINLINESNNQIHRFNRASEEWYNDMMDRVSGWYKKKIHVITFLCGLLISLVLNINTIDIAQKLGTNTEVQLAMIESATLYLQNNQTQDKNEVEVDQIEQLNVELNQLMTQAQKNQSILQGEYPWQISGAKCSDYIMYMIGCLLTSIALSLGSPFWFDLLNKLVKMRSAGVQEKSTK